MAEDAVVAAGETTEEAGRTTKPKDVEERQNKAKKMERRADFMMIVSGACEMCYRSGVSGAVDLTRK